jgi:reactive intermediate/imine deaminase
MVGIALGDGGPRNLPLSTAYRAGAFVYCSGQVGFGPDGKLVAGGIEAETRQTLDNIAAALQLADASLDDVVKVTVWLEDLAEFADFNAVYRGYFPTSPPARSVVQAGLMIGARVEIEAVAYAPGSGSSLIADADR